MNKECYCDPICDFCIHHYLDSEATGYVWCPIKQKEVDLTDFACKAFKCPNCGRTYESFVASKKKQL